MGLALNCIDKFTVNCTWMQETFNDLFQDANKETVRRYTRAYIMMLLLTQLFRDKSGRHMHIRTWADTAVNPPLYRSYIGACAMWLIGTWLSWLVHCSSSNHGSSGGSRVSGPMGLTPFIGR
ncbi:hypothetical protein Ahy_A10g047997 isoform B [Arachis hypogaea]|uniref:Aminotransferase-like plant mobile domain-containing protein n=1 Tax=Arachis hypogaea TaxID=3818 RepID=A0A445B419_ARAHY|nr:hypothetical protein Ahy_A10g047997 isoform B [Arachis hypogaea]